MKFTIDKSELYPALSAAASVTTAKDPIQAFTRVQICVVRGEGIYLSGTNGAQTARAFLRTHCDATEGPILVSAAGLLSRVAALSDGPIIVATKGTQLEIKSGAARYSLGLANPEEAPKFPAADTSEGSMIAADVLRLLLERLAPAMSTETNRTINGIYLSPSLRTEGAKEVKVLLGEATDGRVGAYVMAPFDGVLTAILPGPCIKSMCQVLECVRGAVSIGVAGNRFFIASEALTYTTLTTDGAFAPVAGQIAAAMATASSVARIHRGDVARALKAIRVCDPNDDRVSLRCTDGLVMLGRNKDGEIARDRVDVEGMLPACGFSINLLLRAMSFFSGESVIIHQENFVAARDVNPGPAVILAEGSTDAFVIMPLVFDELDIMPDTGVD